MIVGQYFQNGIRDVPNILLITMCFLTTGTRWSRFYNELGWLDPGNAAFKEE